MAEAKAKIVRSDVTQERIQSLKYLDFIRVASIQAIAMVLSIYEFSKVNSGPLKSVVQSVESRVKTVLWPLCEKFQDVPFALLKFVDRKVDVTLMELDRFLPLLAMEAMTRCFSVVQKAPEVAKTMFSEVCRSGVSDTSSSMFKSLYNFCEPTAKDLYSKYELVAEKYAVKAWHKLNQIPLFPQISNMVVPTAGHLSEKYNQTVCYAARRGYTVATYLPLVPIERMTKIFNDSNATAVPETEVSASSGEIPASSTQ